MREKGLDDGVLLPAGEPGGVPIRLLLFAGLRERRGTEEEWLLVRPGTTPRALYAQLFPDRGEGRIPVLFAVDQHWTDGEAPLREGQELALIPPLGGG